MKKALFILPALALPFGSSQAALLVYEGFQYGNPGNSLDAQPNFVSGDGDLDATGLENTWDNTTSNPAEMSLKAGSLTFSNLPTSGNHIGGQSNLNNDTYHRDFSPSVVSTISTIGTANQSIFFSFLFEKLQNNNGADHEGLAIMNGIVPSPRWDNGNPGAIGRHGFAVAAVAGSNLQAVAYDGTAGTRVVSSNTLPVSVVNGSSNTSTSNVAVNLIVGEISFNTGTGGADVFRLYSATDDGSLSAADLTLIDTIEANVDESLLSTLNLTRQVNVNYDEIRIGTDLNSVIGIPEPSSIGLIALGGLCLLRRRRSPAFSKP